MNRIWHHFEKWEDFQAGFFRTSDPDADTLQSACLSLLRDPERLKEKMTQVIDEWTFSCEANLTNPSMNHQAWLGQAACCISEGTPSFLTKRSWRLLTEEEQDIANHVADRVLEEWHRRQAQPELPL